MFNSFLCCLLGLIQKISDTRSGGGDRQSVTQAFFDFLNAVSNAFLKLKVCLKPCQAAKYTFCILYFTVQSILGLKITNYENVTPEIRGVRKCQISVTYHLNVPLDSVSFVAFFTIQ
jgi:hypothetical protein